MAQRDIVDEALALPGRERAQLAAKLLDSLAEDTGDGVDRAWATELERRAREALVDDDQLEDWQNVRARLRDRVKGLRR